MHVRRLLEVPAMSEIARTVSPEQLTPVRGLADTIMQAAEGNDIRAFVETDYGVPLAAHEPVRQQRADRPDRGDAFARASS